MYLVNEGAKLQDALAGVRESTATGKDRLRDDSREGEHGQPAILDLLELHVVDRLLGLALEKADAEAVVAGSAAAALQHGGDAQPGGHLGKGDKNEGIAQAAVGNEGVVGGGGREALPLLGEGVDAKAEVDGDPPGPGQHADAAVLDLGLAEVVHGEVVRDAKGVESDIADVALGALRRREEGEGLGLLGGVEGNRGTAGRSRGKSGGRASEEGDSSNGLHSGRLGG
mmetsp:Transcript_14610/g.24341  ORF Transcript_14610/g.24341 Transcript_14610/m.24341 type:complete len:227 (-) Transcript_14610:87-767(-)